MFPEYQQAHEGCKTFSAQCGVKAYEQVIKYNVLSALKKCTKFCRNSRTVTTGVCGGGEEGLVVGDINTRP